MNELTVGQALRAKDWFSQDGLYVLFDGQFGSTGKGLLASVIAEHMGDRIDTVTTNAGPNSGHTAYDKMGQEVMTQQIPIAAVTMADYGHIPPTIYLNGGAVIEPSIVWREIKDYTSGLNTSLFIHPHAAVIAPHHQGDQLSHIASTGKGVGPAMMDKLNRVQANVWDSGIDYPKDHHVSLVKEHSKMGTLGINDLGRCFVETAQGWSLGINSGFYPYTTSRECSIAQAIADLGVSPKQLRKSIVSLRTYPIRVGNHPDGGYSGDVYPDQRELTFEELGQKPELTTVTQRVRRIFTWSWTQYHEMLRANEPDVIFINFMNYLPEAERGQFLADLITQYNSCLGRKPDLVLGGYGPLNDDVRVEWINR